MQSSPNTDKTFGIASVERFNEVRTRSKREEFERKTRRDSKNEIQPAFNIDDKIVITNGGWRSRDKHYELVQIIDVDKTRGWSGDDFDYYGVVLKVTDAKRVPRLGHLVKFSEKGRFYGEQYARVKDDGTIKWAGILDESISTNV
jgi:hypothetical protein